jgi:hypothetical protein
LVESGIGRDLGIITLAVGGSVALAFDVGSGVYIASGRGEEGGRIVTGVGSIVSGVNLLVGGALSFSITGEENAAGGVNRSKLVEKQAIAGVCMGLGGLSAGLGVFTLTTFERGPSPEGGASSGVAWGLRPIAVSGGGGGVAIAGRF